MEALFGRLAVHIGYITMEQLAEATRIQARSDGERRLGQILIELGYLDLDQLNALLEHQKAYVEAQLLGLEPSPPKRRSVPGAAPARRSSNPPTPPSPPTGVNRTVKRLRRRPSVDLDDVFNELPFEDPPESPVVAVRRSPEKLLRMCLREAFALGASDVHAHAGTPLRIRIHGRLATYGNYTFEPEALEDELRGMMPANAQAEFDASGQVEFVHQVPDAGRCRTNVYRQLGGVDAVMRLLGAEPPTLSALNLPNAVARVTNFDHGLVLVTGPSGSGRTSTLAGLVDLINEERRVHIVTIEDPIEYVHAHKRSVVNQRQVGEHTESFPRALDAAMREGADVIVLSNMPDRETIELALRAAETGHLVISTMHTSSLIETIQRLQNSLPAERQSRARTLVADTLRAVVTQRLVPTAHQEGRIPAIGMLLITPPAANLIRDDKAHHMGNFMQTNRAAGNCQLDDYLAHLVKTGQITREVARHHALDPARFEPSRSVAAMGG